MNAPEFKNIIWDCTRRINENSNRIFDSMCEQSELTMLQVGILMELSCNGPHTIGSLAEGICVAGANISAMCKKLESMGMLMRTRDRSDERVVNVSLTEKGDATVLDMGRLFDEKIALIINDNFEEDLNDIIRGIQKLDSLLERIAAVNK